MHLFTSSEVVLPGISDCSTLESIYCPRFIPVVHKDHPLHIELFIFVHVQIPIVIQVFAYWSSMTPSVSYLKASTLYEIIIHLLIMMFLIFAHIQKILMTSLLKFPYFSNHCNIITPDLTGSSDFPHHTSR